MDDEGKRHPTTEELQQQLRSDPAGFAKSLDKLLSACSNDESRLFWSTVKRFAERTSKG